jgi:hypothetical protein
VHGCTDTTVFETGSKLSSHKATKHGGGACDVHGCTDTTVVETYKKLSNHKATKHKWGRR